MMSVMRYNFLGLFAFSLFNSCLTFNQGNNLYVENERALPQYKEYRDDREDWEYWKSPAANPRGLVIVVHGLNVKPSKMGTPYAEGTLVKLLLDNGYHVYRVTLKGHSGVIEGMRNVTQHDWIHDAYVQYCQAKTIAGNERLPLYLLGFSLGALVYEVLMHEETPIPVQFEKAILFSPAIAIKPAAKIVLWLRPFTNDTSIIKSVSPEEYRAQKGTSMSAYKALFTMEKLLSKASFKNCNIDTIIFIDKNDEMISRALLRKRIHQYNLANWRVYEVTNTGAVIKPKYHHLLIDTKCVSEMTWQYISKTILGFLD